MANSSANNTENITNNQQINNGLDELVFYDGMSDEELDALLNASLKDEVMALEPLEPDSIKTDPLKALNSQPPLNPNHALHAKVDKHLSGDNTDRENSNRVNIDIEEINSTDIDSHFILDDDGLAELNDKDTLVAKDSENSKSDNDKADNTSNHQIADNLQHADRLKNTGMPSGRVSSNKSSTDKSSTEKKSINQANKAATPVAASNLNTAPQALNAQAQTMQATTTQATTTPKPATPTQPEPQVQLGLNDSLELQQVSQHVSADVLQLKTQLHLLSLQYHELSNTTARLMTQLRHLQSGCVDDFSITYEQMLELRSKLVANKQHASEIPSLLDLVEEALESELYVAQMRKRR